MSWLPQPVLTWVRNCTTLCEPIVSPLCLDLMLHVDSPFLAVREILVILLGLVAGTIRCAVAKELKGIVMSCWCRSCTAERAAPRGDAGAAGGAPAAPAPVARLCSAALQSGPSQGSAPAANQVFLAKHNLRPPKDQRVSILERSHMDMPSHQGLHLCNASPSVLQHEVSLLALS